MPRRNPTPRKPSLTPLITLLESKGGKGLPLPAKLARLYGSLRMPRAGAHPYIISNFVSTLDGVVSLNVKGHESGSDISGFSVQDRMVMGLLRAIADVVIIGAGALGADRQHIWTAEDVYPDLADEYRQLRTALGKQEPPLNVIVSGRGRVDLDLPIFASGKVPVLIVTTTAGAKRLRKHKASDAVEIRAVRSIGVMRASSIINQVRRVNTGKLILVEGGPQLLGDFYAEGILDEQFLTLAPQIAGRQIDDRQYSLVMGKMFAQRSPVWGTLIDLRRGGSHIFLRYSYP
jgi:riboflavin biosynthesis pyrimidine reductase